MFLIDSGHQGRTVLRREGVLVDYVPIISDQSYAKENFMTVDLNGTIGIIQTKSSITLNDGFGHFCN